nr:universal stress protein [uncultured Bilophila sp.]
MAYNRILLPVDGSEHSMHAVANAVELSCATSEIIVATVLPPIPNVIGGDARKGSRGCRQDRRRPDHPAGP